jgi:hypothetical protein
MAAHRLPTAGRADRGSLEGGRGSPEEAGAEESDGGDARSDEGHLGDEERRRQAGGPGLGTAAGVKEDVHPPESGGGEGQESAVASAGSAPPTRAPGAGGGAARPATPTTPVVDVGTAGEGAEEGRRGGVVGLESGRRAPRTAGIRRFDFFDPIERNSWERRHALGDASVVSLGHLAVRFGSFAEL